MRRNNRTTIRGRALILLAQVAIGFWCCGLTGYGCAYADETAADTGYGQETRTEATEYHTPLAGERHQREFMGRTVVVPAINRSHMTSITLGGTFFEPKQGDTAVLPIAALWLRRVWEDSRTRDTISIFVNELEYDKSFGNFELVSHFENFTLPTDLTEVVNNEDIEPTSVLWGTLTGSLGPGIRFPVAPYQVDNDLRLQLLGRVGYFYAQRTDDTGPSLVVPPDTLVYGARLRGRYDGMTRNLMELIHKGFATGWDLDYMHRDKWRDLTPGSTGSNHRDYYRVSGFFVGAGGIPGLSERNRAIVALYAGKTRENSADRYNAFRINGGSFPTEADDVARPHYTRLLYNDIPATAYATASIGYRRELTFFLYLSVIGSYMWADRATVRGVDEVVFRDKEGTAATIALNSGFLWNSEIYLAYARESGLIRGGRSGSGITLNWNKLF